MARRRLDGTTAVITGAGSGIGRALALALDAKGCTLALSDVDLPSVQATADRCRQATTTRLDVRNASALEAHARHVIADHGTVDLVVNNAGVALTADAVDQSLTDIERVLAVNLMGVIHGSQAFLPHLIASGGHLVNISSLFGLLGVPSQSAYAAAKFGVRGYTESLAVEMRLHGHPVSVHCVHPGGIRTDIVRRSRTAGRHRRDEIAAFFDQHLARLDPEEAATAIISGVERGRSRIHVGTDARVLHLLERLLGRHYQRIVSRLASLGPLAPGSAAGAPGNLAHRAEHRDPDAAAG
ncbi:MAG: SDR family oxidoreductase [Nitriliruptorales bacterium]|nr:SDR family oxidoreductase [Nitriliruptorales bacterium]